MSFKYSFLGKRRSGTKRSGRLLILLGVVAAVGLTACGNQNFGFGTRELGFADKVQLGRNSLQFDQKGAMLTECTLVTQLERGRSSATSGGGAG